MPHMTRLLGDLRAAGLMVETVPGWETRGSASFAPAGVTCHWTAGPRGTTKRPSLNVVTYGRPGIPGPLCNVYLDRNGVCVIVAAGRANHAGAGGWKHLRGNSSVYGIEAESAGDHDWTDAQQAMYPRLVAAMLRGLGRDASFAHGHNEWAPTRKIDIRDWPMATMRTQVAQILAGHTPTPTPQAVTATVKEHPTMRLIQAADTKQVAVTDGVTKRYVSDPKTLGDYQKICGPILEVGQYTYDRIPDAVTKFPSVLTSDDVRKAVTLALDGVSIDAEVDLPADLAGRVVDELAARLTKENR